MGFWHGANWTYVMFGFIHGFFIVMSRIWDRYFPKLNLPTLMPRMKALTGALLAFWIFNLTCIPDIFFRSNTIGDAWNVILNIFSTDTTSYLIHNSAAKGAVPSVIEFWVSVVCIVLLLITDYKLYVNKSIGIETMVAAKPFYARWSFYVSFLVIVTLFAYTSKSVFIYFAF